MNRTTTLDRFYNTIHYASISLLLCACAMTRAHAAAADMRMPAAQATGISIAAQGNEALRQIRSELRIAQPALPAYVPNVAHRGGTHEPQQVASNR